MCLRAPDKCKSWHSPARTWAMLFHTSPRCNNGMLIHIHSGKFALYYTLFSDDMLSLKSVIRESRFRGRDLSVAGVEECLNSYRKYSPTI